ncbi:F-box/FBD/LRR-repeat protein [Cardamine amara subsp. amara]|uniref:F-box/FBD/LRR-repeat protein n=1 Tax=Cardamine amara subsp. amara TaxID=228776 RepID=A0ABD1BX45_CARAN
MSKKEANHRSGEDRISLLPDHLLCQILSNLPTKNVVTTSILSTRWRNLWLWVPLLDLNVDDFTDLTTFLSFATRFLDFYEESCLHKLKISFKRDDLDLCPLISWIKDATMRKIHHFEVDCGLSFYIHVVPLTFYTCETLVSLRLHFVKLVQSELASLPNLKVMHLEKNIYIDNETVENLILSCPVLEDLTVIRNIEYDFGMEVLRVRSQTLNSFNLVLDSTKSWYSSTRDDYMKVLIDAPRLEYLSLKDDQSVSFEISNLGSSAEVDIDVSFNMTSLLDLNDSLKISATGKLLTGLSSVRDMTLSRTTSKIICHYLKHERMPQFSNMKRLNVKLYVSDIEMLPKFLESCPNLESLILKMRGVTEEKEISLSSVPKCLQTSLEHVEMVRSNCENVEEMKLIKYFLENSLVLKKFKICLPCRNKKHESIIVKELVNVRRCSNACHVIVRIRRRGFF